MSGRSRVLGKLLGKLDRGPTPHPDIVRLTPEEIHYLTTTYDQTTPLPPGADTVLAADNPKLVKLQQAYASHGLPATAGSTWSREALEGFLDLKWFRGDSLITYHYRDLPRVSRLKFFLFLKEVESKVGLSLLERLGEDGAFGCWTYRYPGYPRVSRDLLDSANEIWFLESQLGLSKREGFSVLDIGAGYGRLAHRLCSQYPNIRDYCCVDGVAESTFLCDYYLEFRGVAPARTVALPALDSALATGSFELAVNVHSFSEMPLNAIAAWLNRLDHLAIPHLMIVPNEPDELLSQEVDGSRLDYSKILSDIGYRLHTKVPAFQDPAIRELVGVHDHFHLFSREGGELQQ